MVYQATFFVGFIHRDLGENGSMVLLYMVLHGYHQYTPFMLANIPAPWILWDCMYIIYMYIYIYMHNIQLSIYMYIIYI